MLFFPFSIPILMGFFPPFKLSPPGLEGFISTSRSRLHRFHVCSMQPLGSSVPWSLTQTVNPWPARTLLELLLMRPFLKRETCGVGGEDSTPVFCAVQSTHLQDTDSHSSALGSRLFSHPLRIISLNPVIFFSLQGI